MNKLYFLLIFSFVSFLVYGAISKNNSTQIKKEKRLSCQSKTITFEKISDLKNINEAISLLKSGNYTITSYIEYSKYMKSQISKYLNLEKANKLLNQSIEKYAKEQKYSNKKLQIKYYIYENDKKDSGKKSKKAKLYAGYLVFEFLLENKVIYKIQTDYMKMDTSDIPQRFDCVINSFTTLKKD